MVCFLGGVDVLIWQKRLLSQVCGRIGTDSDGDVRSSVLEASRMMMIHVKMVTALKSFFCKAADPTLLWARCAWASSFFERPKNSGKGLNNRRWIAEEEQVLMEPVLAN